MKNDNTHTPQNDQADGSGSPSTTCSIASDFERWWHNEGSGLPPKKGEDREAHMMRVAKIAWDNAAYKEREPRYDF